MRKVFISSFVLLVLLSVMGVAGMVAAQDKTPLELGQWKEGTLTADTYEAKYTFTGTKGQLILVEMIPAPGTYDLDPDVVLRNSDGDILGQNDDYAYPLALVVSELPADGTYTVLATRSGGKGGSSTGDYWLRADAVDPVASGTKLDVTLHADSSKNTPNVFVLKPTSSGPVKIGFNQKVGDLYASLNIGQWVDDSYPTSVMSLSDTTRVSAATFSVDLEADQIYILVVDQGFGSYSSDPTDATVTVTVS